MGPAELALTASARSRSIGVKIINREEANTKSRSLFTII
jgi:hypothetical protein